MARRTMSVLGQWTSRAFSLELEGRSAVLHFVLNEKPHDQVPETFKSVGLRETFKSVGLHETFKSVGLHETFKSVGLHERCYSLFPCDDDRIQRAKNYWGLKEKLAKLLPPECKLFNINSYLPNVKGSLIRGYFLKDASECSSVTRLLLRDLFRDERVLVCSYSRGEDGRQWSQHLWSDAEDQDVQHYMVACEEPDYHPAVLNIVNSDVFYSLTEAYKVFQESCDIIPQSRAVLELVEQRPKSRHGPGFPIIVIEGLDATGKTTLTQSLSTALGATLLRSPPHCLSPWRASFDQEPPLIRRAFYALGNYITAEQIGQEASRAPVIVDRYWHSTAAYAIAHAVTGPVGSLPPEGSEIYRWPADLLQPSMVVLLTLDPEERRKRLEGRGQGQTEEEQKLDQNHLFRLRVEMAYRRVRGPACVTVDASPSADKVLRQVLLLIRENCHL